MKVAILDDYFDTLRSRPCFSKLRGFDVTVWNDHTDDVSILADRLRDADVSPYELRGSSHANSYFPDVR